MKTKKTQSFVYVEEWGPSRARHGHLGGIARDLELLRKTIRAAAKEGAYPNLKRIPKKPSRSHRRINTLRTLRGEKPKKHRYDGTWVDAWTYGPDWAPESSRITIKQVHVW